MIRTIFAATAVAALGMVGAAQAATLNGKFTVIAVNAQNQSLAQSEATAENGLAALLNAENSVPGYAYDEFEYEGDVDFASYGGLTSIADWLASGVNGAITGLDAAFGGLLLSKGDIDAETATTTFFAFILQDLLGPSDFTINHDDGVAVYDLDEGIVLVGGLKGPNSLATTVVEGFDGGALGILYVATNSDPSVLNVDVTPAPVPLPAGLPLLAVGLGGLALLRLRRKAA